MAEPVVIGYGQNKWVNDATSKAMGLFAYNLSSIESMHDDNNANYQVPVGKKFIVLSITVHPKESTAGLGGVLLAQHNVADAAGGTRFYGVTTSTRTNSITTDMPYYATIDAGNYINCQATNAGVNVSIFGVEVDV